MAKVFIGIALVFMLATAGIGFVLKTNVDKLQAGRLSANGKITAAEASAKAAKKDAETAQKDAKDAKDAKEVAEKMVQEKAKESEDNKKAAEEAKLVVDGKDKEIAKLNMDVDDLKKNKGDPEQVAKLTAQVTEANAAKENAEKEVKEAKLALDSEVAKGSANATKVVELQKDLTRRQQNVQKAGLQGRILAVNAGWNFVVLSVGDKQGVVNSATLLVVRGNEPIARLRVTSVEPSTSIADVLPGSVRRGTSVQPGDTVIFEGSRNTVPPGTNKPGTDSTTTAPLPPATNSPLPNN